MSGVQVQNLGNAVNPLLVIEGITGASLVIADIAADMTPFPPTRGGAYRRLRRVVTPLDVPANRYASDFLRKLAPSIDAAFGVDGFE